MRFALGVKGYTEMAERTALEHARSVLRGGEVTVTIQVGNTLVDVSRTAEESSPRAAAAYPRPIMLSQNEIESVGLAAAGRLRLIDSFRQTTENLDDRSDVSAAIASLSVELQNLSAEISAMDEQLHTLPEAQSHLLAARKEQDASAASMRKLTNEQEQLKKLSAQGAAAAVRTEFLSRAKRQLSDWRTKLEAARAASPVLEQWPSQSGGDDPLTETRASLASAEGSLADAVEAVTSALSEIQQALVDAGTEKATLEQSSRDLRKILEQSQQGAGELSKRIATLQQRVGTLTALQAARTERLKRREELSRKRHELLDQFDHSRDQQYRERSMVATQLNSRLSPRIRIDVEKSGVIAQYSSTIAGALRGSGIHYNSLAPVLARTVSPRELVEAVESDDVDLLANIAGIPLERAMRLAAFMRTQGLASILTAPLDDLVTLRLLDGGDYKDTESLSTGQRCTVVLPILLAHDERPVIVDQPEDHLDNGFIVETVIQAIRNRRRGQMIFSTHNANIPVLGEAAQVIVMGSDGRHGFVRHSGSLDDGASVEAITTIMEGGRDAFQRRAAFYGQKSTGR
jgi:hypothetical protein